MTISQKRAIYYSYKRNASMDDFLNYRCYKSAMQ